jgi:hypothetical protein
VGAFLRASSTGSTGSTSSCRLPWIAIAVTQQWILDACLGHCVSAMCMSPTVLHCTAIPALLPKLPTASLTNRPEQEPGRHARGACRRRQRLLAAACIRTFQACRCAAPLSIRPLQLQSLGGQHIAPGGSNIYRLPPRAAPVSARLADLLLPGSLAISTVLTCCWST